MKKKIIVPIIFVLVIIIGIIGFILWDNRTIATITLDINPSIEINLNKDSKVKNVVALNKDAKDIISNNLNGKSLDNALKVVTNNLIDKGYINDNNVTIVLYSEGNVKNKKIESSIKTYFGEKDIAVDLVVIEKVTNEDRKLAKKYNISPAKASYIKTVLEDNKNINIEDLADKLVNEIKETKETGNYCPKGSILEGDWCLKEIKRVDASEGEVCPSGYVDYKGICYEETRILERDNYICRDEFKLENDKCVRKVTQDAIPVKYSCSTGTAKTRLEAGLTNAGDGDANDIVCVDASNATHPKSPCELNDGTEYTVAGGVCYWHRAPVIAAGCPGKIQVGDSCWDNASGILVCAGARDGKQYSSRDEFCEGSVIYNDPIVNEYKCEDKRAKLTGSKCVFDEIENAEKERYCADGYSLVNNDRCINKKKTANKENGFVCEGEDTRLQGNICIIYERKEVMHS